MTCQHAFHDPRVTCSHQEVGTTGRCLWHNVAVTKGEPYVRALFQRADAGAPSWAEAHLAGLDLRGLRLAKRCLSRADLRDADLSGADLSGADLTHAVLRRVTARRANLRGADLTGADLTGANLTGADLREARLVGALLDTTALQGADLRGADLDGARVIDFRWNRLTRFQGIRGIDPAASDGDDDATQIFLAPVAMGEDDLDTPAQLGVEVVDDLARTRVYRPGSLAAALPPPSPSLATTIAAPMPLSPAVAPRRLRHLLIPVVAAFLGGGAVMAAVLHRAIDPTDVRPRLAEAEARLRASEVQRQADLAQVDTERELGRTLAAQLATAKAAVAAGAEERGRLSALVTEREAELGRLRDASDRAEILSVKVAELDVLNRDLAGASARQDRLSRILAGGVDRYRDENLRLAGELQTVKERAQLLDDTQRDLARTKGELTAARQERDALQGLYQQAHKDLAVAKADIERYLGRIHATQFQGLLTDDSGSPLHPVTLGKALSLGGDYLVSLAVDKADPKAPVTRALSVRLVVQRPSAAANPDATVVLYDSDQRPLRRLSYSFPHVDDGAPFMTAATTIACDRQPAFARLILAPGEAKVATR